MVKYTDEIREADTQNMHNAQALSRTEIDTLIGLMAKSSIDWELPALCVLSAYIYATELLLGELHGAIFNDPSDSTGGKCPEHKTFNTYTNGRSWREPFFYGGESAYSFQYLSLAAKKHEADTEWLMANYGFTINDAIKVASAIEHIQSHQPTQIKEEMRTLPTYKWALLLFTASVSDIATGAGISTELVELVLKAFTLPANERNNDFRKPLGFNMACTKPLLHMPDGKLLSLQTYTLAAAIYDTPSYWMMRDNEYQPKLAEHRGDFTEQFTAERLGLVFGEKQVHTNVNICGAKGTTSGEIDILVTWGDRAIIVQAKSKRLTLEALQGNNQAISDDFKKSIQKSYDQAITCAQHLEDKQFKLLGTGSRQITLPHKLKEIYIFCVISDHYPALHFQVMQFLETKPAPKIQPPLVMDIFTIDVMTEMLQSPLYFLSYVNKRSKYMDKVVANHEITILAHHLKYNLWFEPDIDLICLDDDLLAELNVAMMVRRQGANGKETPDGILTHNNATTLGPIIKQIGAQQEPETIELGLMLLTLSGDSLKKINNNINRCVKLAKNDGKCHDVTFGFTENGFGLTIHCSNSPKHAAESLLRMHCQSRKYRARVTRWFGLCINPKGRNLRFGILLCSQWKQNDAMDNPTHYTQAPYPIELPEAPLHASNHRRKIGRNEPCPCGSGRKHKKCCLGKSAR